MKDTVPAITTGPLPGSRKIHVTGELHKIRVPMREIAVTGEAPLCIYDSSGPYTDAGVTPDIAAGLAPQRSWLAGRADLEETGGRAVTAADNGFASGSRLVPDFPVRRPGRSGAMRRCRWRRRCR